MIIWVNVSLFTFMLSMAVQAIIMYCQVRHAVNKPLAALQKDSRRLECFEFMVVAQVFY
jgi:nitrate/nitrite-specific signal transduction histidine kinase